MSLVARAFDFHENPSAPWDLRGQLPAELQTAHPRRQASFVAGRWCASAALEASEWTSAQEVGRDDHGLPVWPPEVVGSITHTFLNENGGSGGAQVDAETSEQGNTPQPSPQPCVLVAASVVLPAQGWASVGLDFEGVMSEERAQAVSKRLATAEEWSRLVSLADGNSCDPRVVTLMFSAKEALFKAVHPFVNRFFGFDSYVCQGAALSESSVRPDCWEGTLEFEAVPHPSLVSGGVLPARLKHVSVAFQVAPSWVATLCCMPHDSEDLR